jgi:hypothetical protein
VLSNIGVFGLSAMPNFGRYGGIFLHNPIWRSHKAAHMAGFWLAAMDCHPPSTTLLLTYSNWHFLLLGILYLNYALLKDAIKSCC